MIGVSVAEGAMVCCLCQCSKDDSVVLELYSEEENNHSEKEKR